MKPTREQIEQADAKTLRVMVAEMMGWERWTGNNGPDAAMLFEPGSVGPAFWSRMRRCGDDVPLSERAWACVGRWPINMNDAMEVVEHMWERGYGFELRCGFGKYESATFFLRDQTPGAFPDCSVGTGTTAPLAICKAALYAWINEPDNPPKTLE